MQVTCFEYADQLLPREDPDAAKVLQKALENDGLIIRLGQCFTFCIFCLIRKFVTLNSASVAMRETEHAVTPTRLCLFQDLGPCVIRVKHTFSLSRLQRMFVAI